MADKPSETVIRAWARLLKAHRIALSSVEKQLKAAELPPLAWYDVLLEVERAGAEGIRPFELERAMLLEQYNLSRLVDRIHTAGYIQRRAHEQDGRGQLIAITEQGKALRRKMWLVYARAIQMAIGKRLVESQAKELEDLLDLLIEQSDDELR